MKIRPPIDSDFAAVAMLVGQLGYPTSEQQMRDRLDALRNGSHVSFVAEMDGKLLGFAGARVDPGFEYDGAQARLLALIVDENARCKGIGRALVDAVEQWARSRGAHKMMVNTHHRRKETHAFYRAVGFESTGLRFVKTLDK